ncbi:MAG: hypothetical protein Q6361_06660 [Candidatus Hermodarchaeota archaeon]|nr:hypothetical protein [Candidatus Hermodarchaeota archaeon]
MKQYIGMIEVLGEGGELQPLHWNPNHLIDGRAILIVDESEAIVWVWLGRGTTMLQRSNALRQARFIMRNGIHVEGTHIGTKCTNFIEIPGNLGNERASLLRKLVEANHKTSDFLVVIKDEQVISTFEEAFQDRVEAVEQTIIPQPILKPKTVRRRILTYEEQLATKVLFAVTDCYGQATMIPLGPSEFQVSVLRLQLRFICQGDDILFTEIHAADQEDVDAFARCFGQQPQLTGDGQWFTISPEVVGEAPRAKSQESVSVVDSMRKQLSEIGTRPKPEEEAEPPKETDEEKGVDEENKADNEKDDTEEVEDEENKDNPGYEMFN